MSAGLNAPQQALPPLLAGTADAVAQDPLAHYCPHAPWPKQQLFLSLDCQEAFYGGAAGGGKSEALLMAALQYVHVPGYAALILRRDTQRMQLSGGVIARSHAWFAEKGAKWQGAHRRWTFPTAGAPATISFGYLRDAFDKYRYGSSEYQYIAFDELTEFAEDDYLFLFSRLRRTRDLNVPLRVRSASNPGCTGHLWVRQRFISDEALLNSVETADSDPPAEVFWKNGSAYVPARIRDNPGLDAQSYLDSLAHLPPLERERLMHGDWSVREEGLIRPEWLRYYTVERGQLQLCDAAGALFTVVAEASCRRFATIDPAGTSADKAREQRGRPASWSVIQVWDQPWGELGKFLLLRHQWRGRVGFDGLCHAMEAIYREWQPERMWIENEKLGQAAVDLLSPRLPLETIATGGADKVARAAPLITKMERGEIFFPQHEPWRSILEQEFLAWSGRDDDPSDQIDSAAYAARIGRERETGVVRVKGMGW